MHAINAPQCPGCNKSPSNLTFQDCTHAPNEAHQHENNDCSQNCACNPMLIFPTKLASAEAASQIFDKLTERGIYVRYFPQDGLDRGLRISIGTDDEMDQLLEELRTLI